MWRQSRVDGIVGRAGGAYGRIRESPDGRRRADRRAVLRGRPRESSAGLGGRIRRQGAAIHVDNERVNGEMVRGRRGRLLPDQSPPSSLLPTIPAEFRCRPSQRGKALADRKADSGGFVTFLSQLLPISDFSWWTRALWDKGNPRQRLCSQNCKIGPALPSWKS